MSALGQTTDATVVEVEHCRYGEPIDLFGEPERFLLRDIGEYLGSVYGEKNHLTAKVIFASRDAANRFADPDVMTSFSLRATNVRPAKMQQTLFRGLTA
jgi:hypothetical protein